MRLLLISLLFVFQTIGVFGQNDSIILGFSADDFNNKVLLSWDVKQGNTCIGIDIFRSVDSVNFTKIGDIVGVCGSTQETIRYTFTDPFPVLNAKSFYRINLGGIGFSRIVEMELYDFGTQNYLLFPNPVDESSVIRFSNETADERTLTIYKSNGEEVRNTTTKDNFFPLSPTELGVGAYRFIIESANGGQLIVGEFIVP